jgi:tetratricopeptide (TPR) repeat protein
MTNLPMTIQLPRHYAPSRLILPLVAALIAACAHGEDRGEEMEDRPRELGPRTSETSESADEEVGAAPPREIDDDRAIAIDTGAGTPQRRASLRVVEEGKGYLIAGRSREAADRFQRATRMDPSNGFAYYYLGRARIASGDARGAVGVLQKAESLFGPYPEWRARAAGLLASLGAR